MSDKHKLYRETFRNCKMYSWKVQGPWTFFFIVFSFYLVSSSTFIELKSVDIRFRRRKFEIPRLGGNFWHVEMASRNEGVELILGIYQIYSMWKNVRQALKMSCYLKLPLRTVLLHSLSDVNFIGNIYMHLLCVQRQIFKNLSHFQ